MGLTLILALLTDAPQIIGLASGIVKGVEGLFGAGTGPAKKAAASATLTDILGIFAKLKGDGVKAPQLDEVSTFVEVVVKILQAEHII